MIIKIHISATLKFQISKNVKFSDSMACDKKKKQQQQQLTVIF